MKKVFSLLICFSLLACANHSAKNDTAKPVTTDTQVVVATYEFGQARELRQTMLLEAYKDTVLIDTANMEKRRVFDTLYFAPVRDSLRVNGKAVTDSTGKPLFQMVFYPLHDSAIFGGILRRHGKPLMWGK